MSTQTPFVITISRQLGSGGAYLGQRIAARLHIHYADREIIRKAAGMIHLPEGNKKSMSGNSISELESLLKSFDHAEPKACCKPLVALPPPDDAGRVTETSLVTWIGQHWHSVIVGRGGYHLLRHNPRHLAVYIHADMDFRLERVQTIYDVSPAQALKLIEASDRDRKRFLYRITGSDWENTRQYHLSIDTSALGFILSEEMILDSMLARLENSLDPERQKPSNG